MAHPAFHAVVHGRVQGVGFRVHAAREARRLGLVGWVRNLGDGTVEVEASGEKEALMSFHHWLREGPPLSRVDRVDVQWDTRESALPGFSILG